MASRSRLAPLRPVLLLGSLLPAGVALRTNPELKLPAYACPNNCRGRGICRFEAGQGAKCRCFPGYEGPDCSLTQCPYGAAWTDFATATDTAHGNAICSNMGFCNGATGKCECRIGFEGPACERMSCPNNCNNRGRCLSLREMALLDVGPYLHRKVAYDLWDADKVLGCLCDLGWTGYDCSERFCPYGDDPLTTANQANEVHTILCTCPNSCSGGFQISHKGWTTDTIPYNAPTAIVKARLEELPTIDPDGIDIAFDSGTTVCGASTVTTSITFTINAGDLPASSITSTLASFDNTISAVTDITASDSTIAISSTLYGAISDGDPMVYTGSATQAVDNTIDAANDLTASDKTIAISSEMYSILTNGDAVVYTTGSSGNAVPLTNGRTYYALKAPDSTAQFKIVLFDTDANANNAATDTDANMIASGGVIPVTSTGSGTATDHQLALAQRTLQPLVEGTTYYAVKAPESAADFKIVLFDTLANANAATKDTNTNLIASTGAQAVTTTNSGLATDHKLSSTAAPTLTMRTIQQVKCTCTGTCGGAIYLRYDGETTAAISHDATDTAVKSALEALNDISSVTVTFSSGAAICGASEVTTSITFTGSLGNTPAITAINALSGTSTTVTVATNDGTRVSLPCSGRGDCNPVTGACLCYGLNTTSGWKNYTSSNGKVGAAWAAGGRGDCGFYETAASPDDCPETEQIDLLTAAKINMTCSGHGRCDTSTYACQCYPGWEGGSCSKRTCPTGRAWFDEASADNVAHAKGAVCSNKGICNRGNGACTCQQGWTGAACERLSCLGSNQNAGFSSDGCSGNGQCKSMAQLAKLSTTGGVANSFTYGLVPNKVATWDAEMLYGCYCDKSFFWEPDRNQSVDYMCSRRPCPTGDNPLTNDNVTEIQKVTCTGTSGTFNLQFGTETTAEIAFDATAAQVEAALELLNSIEDVAVSFGEGSAAACSASGVPIFIDFFTPNGDVGLLVAGATSVSSIAVAVYQEGRDGQQTEVQTITCTGTSGSFKLTFRSATSEAIAYDADTIAVMDALQALDTIGTVEVTFGAGAVACSGSGVAISVNFTSEFGDLPIMSYSDSSVTSLSIAETRAGSKENEVCSGQGICDYATGRCKCFKGFSSSDGFGGEGTRGDCGRMNEAAAGECSTVLC